MFRATGLVSSISSTFAADSDAGSTPNVSALLVAILVGVSVGWFGVFADLIKDRRVRRRDQQQAAYADFCSALNGWAHLHYQLKVAYEQPSRDLMKIDKLLLAEAEHERSVLLPAQARLRLVAPADVVKKARQASDALRASVGRQGPGASLWPDYSEKFRALVAACRADVLRLKKTEDDA